MDKSTYKAGRRMLLAAKLAEFFEGIYGLRMVANAEADFAEMMTDEDNALDFIPEDEDED